MVAACPCLGSAWVVKLLTGKSLESHDVAVGFGASFYGGTKQ